MARGSSRRWRYSGLGLLKSVAANIEQAQAEIETAN